MFLEWSYVKQLFFKTLYYPSKHFNTINSTGHLMCSYSRILVNMHMYVVRNLVLVLWMRCGVATYSL